MSFKKIKEKYILITNRVNIILISWDIKNGSIILMIPVVDKHLGTDWRKGKKCQIYSISKEIFSLGEGKASTLSTVRKWIRFE